MAESERYSPSNSGWPNLQQATQQQYKFQALKDWNWFQTSPTSPWSPNPRCPFSSHSGPVQHRSTGFSNDQFRRIDRGRNQWRDRSHAPGTKRIKLDTPEEIAKWREERKRNYPTKSNIKKKIELIMVKEKRGDVLETSEFRHFKRCGNLPNMNRRGRGFQTPNGHAYEHKHIYPGIDMVKQASTLTCSSYNVDPLGALATSDPDSENEESVKEISVAPKKMTSALGSLMSSYGEDVTESDEEPEDALIVKSALALEENKALLAAYSSQPNQDIAPKLGKRPSTEESVISHQTQDLQSESHPQQSGWSCGREQRGRQYNKPRAGAQKCRPTLLEMLLAQDIRHERNVVLQCIRYIIHKEFFNIAHQDSKTLGETKG
ncbi:Nuclear fragile X mental retardation-interacting protein 1 [Bagarius yarrelli]|uniref:Nuclear fragile X mental retardation-interacting protein 1 n=1 Tax=Bagarius yarrelli TaxID=175774 RepID=A0A556V867_BAGYA|nr:Nuclear fragile X mental retardation-interacting protein 1 [Bagarius yarrelli]